MIDTSGFLDSSKIVDLLDLREGMRVADFGCGSGHFSVLMARKVGTQGKVSALDIQEPPLEALRAKAQALALANIETIRGNLEVPGGSSLQDTSQDLVFIANILFQSKLKEDILREARRILKDGGRMSIIEWKPDAKAGPPADLRTDEATLKAMVAANGFTFEKNIDAGTFHFGLIFRK